MTILKKMFFKKRIISVLLCSFGLGMEMMFFCSLKKKRKIAFDDVGCLMYFAMNVETRKFIF